ncbi:putative ATP-grasp domain-containing protein [Seiridium unicorne]|uniref:ATP-grasp domain-containing protein n=1 Tax=Seiridium unicorne TaxID=138068 RepID=A0ABR2UFG3_9PEZI
MNNLTKIIALTYEDPLSYIELGYSAEECLDFPSDGEIQAICEELEQLGHTVTKVPGIEALVAHLANGDGSRWDLAFNMAEGFHGSAREAQVPGLLEAYQIPYTFSDAHTTTLCQDKQRTKIVLQHYDIPTAPFFLVEANEEGVDFSKFGAVGLSYPLFAKPVSEGTSKGINSTNKANCPEELVALVRRLRAKFRNQGILIEPFLPGREITVSILGTGSHSRVIGATEWAWLTETGETDRTLSGQYASDCASTNSMDEIITPDWKGRTHGRDSADMQVQAAYKVALDTWKVLRCRDAGRVDTRFDTLQVDAAVKVLEASVSSDLEYRQ